MDGTIAESKSAIDKEMSGLLGRLLEVAKVSVISGGSWEQFEKQLVTNLDSKDRLSNLFLLPNCGTKYYKYDSNWIKLYSEDFTKEEKAKIIQSLQQAIDFSDFKIAKVWGEIIEDRGSQITYSALGQQAPIEEKKKWDPDFSKRKKMKEFRLYMIFSG